MKLNLKRPIVFFDLETTGVDSAKDRIVEISMVKVMPDGEEIVKTRRINPQMPIPAAATEIHGITDEYANERYHRYMALTAKEVLEAAEQFWETCHDHNDAAMGPASEMKKIER